MDVACGITTCPRGRQVSYLSDSLQSLHDAGFRNVRIFDDPQRSGAYRNFQRALRELLCCVTADAVILFQDDIRVARGTCDWLRGELWPHDANQIGVLSLYCPEDKDPGGTGWQAAPLSEELDIYRVSGALAYLFPRHAAERLANNFPRQESLQMTDAAVGKFCLNHRLKYLWHVPSLVEHVGAVSAISNQYAGLNASRRAARFVERVSDIGNPCQESDT